VVVFAKPEKHGQPYIRITFYSKKAFYILLAFFYAQKHFLFGNVALLVENICVFFSDVNQ